MVFQESTLGQNMENVLLLKKFMFSILFDIYIGN